MENVVFKIKKQPKQDFNDLDKSEILGIEKGSLVKLTRSTSVIYRVERIYKGSVDDNTMIKWESSCKRNNLFKLKKFIETYKKDGNFGSNFLQLRTIIKGSKKIARRQVLVINEIEYSGEMSHTKIVRININDEKTYTDAITNDLKNRILRLENKVKSRETFQLLIEEANNK
jgi:hypothetical protein